MLLVDLVRLDDVRLARRHLSEQLVGVILVHCRLLVVDRLALGLLVLRLIVVKLDDVPLHLSIV